MESIVKTNKRGNSSKIVHFQGLNEVQLGLLRMFSRPMSIEQTRSLKRVIVNYLAEELDKEVERVVEMKGITAKDYEKLQKQHHRTPKK